MPSTKSSKSPTPTSKLDEKKQKQLTLARKIAAMDPADREKLRSLERLRRNLTVTGKG